MVVVAVWQAEHPEWDDERTFQEARKWTTAHYQHTTYNDFLPTFMGSAMDYIPPYTVRASCARLSARVRNGR